MPSVRRQTAWNRKPPLNTQINWGHAFAQGLQAFYAVNEGVGSVLSGFGNAPNLTLVGSTAWTQGPQGVGLNGNAATTGAQGTLPASLKLTWPVTLIMGCTVLGSGNATNAICFGATFDNVGSSNPFISYSLNNSSGIWHIDCASGASFTDLSTSQSVVTGTDVVVAAEIGASAQKLYINGVQVFSGSSALSNPNFSATSQMSICDFANRKSGVLFYWGGVYNAVLPAAAHYAIGQSPNSIWQMFQPVQGEWIFAPSASGVVGSGAITLGGFIPVGSGTFSDVGSGAITLGALSPVGAGTVGTMGSGAITLGALSPSGSGSFTVTGSGSVALAGLGVAGVGSVPAIGTGAITLGSVIVAGIGSTAGDNDILTGIQQWFQTQPMLQALLSDGQLHHAVAPEDTLLPYATFFLVSEVTEIRTTAGKVIRANVQFNIHHDTDAAARPIADAFADSIDTITQQAAVPIVVYGRTAMCSLTKDFGIQLGEGLAPQGEDCWISHFTTDVLYTK